LASAASSSITKHIDALFRTGTAMGVTDGSLLDRFRCGQADEAEAAFTVLVERHGPMVQHICRRILGDRHDAEDAAQAVFLVLSRQAHSIRRTDSVASWLYEGGSLGELEAGDGDCGGPRCSGRFCGCLDPFDGRCTTGWPKELREP
jgi:Sigma-70 region 2